MRKFQFFAYDAQDKMKDVQSVLDHVLDAAKGVKLPGKFGLLQAGLEIWSNPPAGGGKISSLAWLLKSSLNTAGLLREYHLEQNPVKAKAQPNHVQEYIKSMGWDSPREFMNLGGFIYAYAEPTLPCKTVSIPGTKNAVGKIFTTSSGVQFGFIFPYGQSSNDNHRDYFNAIGPLVSNKDSETFIQDIRALIWKTEGGSDLQLSRVSGGNTAHYEVTSIGAADDYVSHGADSVWADVHRVTERCLAFASKGMPRRILLHGPPGCGKTSLSRRIAGLMGGRLTLRISAEVAEYVSNRTLFQFLNVVGPGVLLFDDIDRSGEVTSTLLHLMEGGTSAGSLGSTGAVIIGTANAVGELDPALLRPGRFDEVVLVSEPEADHRREILKHYLTKFGVNLDSDEIDSWVHLMDGFSPADIREIVSSCSVVGLEHVEAEIERVAMQRELYRGASVADYLASRRASSPTKPRRIVE